MVKQITFYYCEICNRQYDRRRAAEECESKGEDKLLKLGTIFSLPHHGKKLVFAIIKVHEGAHSGHHHSYSTWACRDTDIGDNCGGTQYCGLDSWTKIMSANKKAPAYKRMVKALKDARLPAANYKKEGGKG